ncbi:MAG: hypothetical protein HRF49_08620 [bacterium]
MRFPFMLLTLAFLLAALTGCPAPQTEGEGGYQAGSPAGKPAAPDFTTSKLASIGNVKLGMSPDEVKAVFPEDGDLAIGEAIPPEGEPLQFSASPKEGKTGPESSFGFLEGGLVLYGEHHQIPEAEFKAKVEELKGTYGEGSLEPPDILTKTKFYSGEEPEAAPPAPGAEGETPVEAPPADKAPPAEAPPAEEKEPQFPPNTVFWSDPANNIVIVAGYENGAGMIMAMRTDKVDAYFDKVQEEVNKMIEEAMKGMSEQMGGQTPPADGSAPPPPPAEAPPATEGKGGQ